MSSRWLTAVATFITAALLLSSPPAPSQQSTTNAEPPTQPMLRIESGGVTALPRAVAVDERRGQIYTGGDDKVVRVWRREDLRLMDTWRLPSGTRNEGQVNALAISPDGRMLAVAGWTGLSWDRAMSIYVFDTGTGQIVKRLSGISPVIGALAFSPDGQYIAAGLVGPRAGVIVIKWNEGTLALHDPDFDDSVLGVDFSAAELAVVSFDGTLRLYDHRIGKLRSRVKLAEGRMPTRVRFTPDGQALAIGFHDVAQVAVYTTRTLTREWLPDCSAIQGQQNLSTLTWSIDGRRLVAGGDPGAGAASRIFEWQRGAGTRPLTTPVATQRLAGLAALADGSMLVLAEDPLIAILRPGGSVITAESSGTIDQRQASATLAVSDDAMSISAMIDVSRRTAVTIDLAKLKVSRGAVTAPPPAPAATIDARWKPGEAALQLNGRAVELEAYEFVRSVEQGAGGVLVGTEYGVRFHEPGGKLRWLTEVGGVAWAARASRDGRYVVAAVSDGTFRWLRASDGQIVLSLFAHPRNDEWVLWTPEGYYASSPKGDELIGWQINRTKRQRADFYSAAQFERILYRPDIVRAALSDTPTPAVKSARGSFQIKDLASIAPPRIDIVDVAPDPRQPSLVRARFKATRNTARMRDYTVFVDDIPITRASDRGLQPGEGDTFTKEVSFAPLTRGGTLRVEVRTDNGVGIGVGSMPLPLTALPAAAARGRASTGDLYLLSIGARNFAALPPAFKLAYTERDATEVGVFFAKQSGRSYNKVISRIISDDSPIKPTQAAIRDSLAFLKQANANDTVILFLSSHGVRDERGNYYFAVADSRTNDLCAILPAATKGVLDFCRGAVSANADRSSFIEWRVFFDAVSDSAGRRILIVDTCEAGNIRGDLAETGSLRKRSASSRFSLLLAAGDGEESQEYAAGQHGLFTFALLKGLGGAAAQADGVVTLESAYSYTRTEVDRLRDRRLGPMTPSLDASPLLRSMPLAVAR
ncbi:hypothetical protein BH09PSE5_BH09PSE5_09460 [soil metagenome]